MAVDHLIEPFPSNLDRTHFGSWLSGFTDGEGCFRLCYNNRADETTYKQLYASFDLGQRIDDVATLKLIQSYFECGKIYIDNNNYAKFDAAPKATYRMSKIFDIVTVLLPHFETFQLIAKKRNDFLIFREGALLIFDIVSRPMRTGKRGRLPKWLPHELTMFSSLCLKLKQQRVYRQVVEKGTL